MPRLSGIVVPDSPADEESSVSVCRKVGHIIYLAPYARIDPDDCCG